MRKLIAAISLGLVLPNIAIAQSNPTLWNDLSYGMPQAEVKAKYPQKGLNWPKVELTSECKGELAFEYVKGKLVKVVMVNGTKSEGPCGDVIEKTLLGKYGEPDIEERGQRKDIMECRDRGGIARSLCEASLDQYKIVKKWVNADGVEMRLKRNNGIATTWKLEWYMAVQGSSEAAAKL